MSSLEPLESEVLHALKNCLALIVSLSQLAMLELPNGDVRADLAAIRDAGNEALGLLPQLMVPCTARRDTEGRPSGGT